MSFQSKALKENYFGKDDKEHGKLVTILLYLPKLVREHIYYPLESLYSRYTERIGRSYAFAKIGWLNYDFDSHSLYDLMAFKLARIHKALVDGVAYQDDEDMNALLEAIKLCNRLYDEKYDDSYQDEHDKKWGEIKSEHIPCKWDAKGKISMYQWKTSRDGVQTPEQEAIEREEWKKCYEQGEADRIKDLDRLNELFKKHLNSWWD
jgi:hypothetical protein